MSISTQSVANLERTIGLSPIFNIIVNNRLHVLMTVIGLVGVVFAIENIAFSPIVMAAVVSVIYGSYVLNIVFDQVEDKTNYGSQYQVFWASRFVTTVFISVLLVFPIVLSAIHSWHTAMIAILCVLAASLYSIPFIPGEKFGWRRIKDIPILKNSVCALVWGATVVILPHSLLDVPLSATSWALFVLLVLMNFYIEVLWDLRDIDGDRETRRMRSIPMLLGKERTIVGLQAMNAAIAAATCAFAYARWIPEIFYVYAFLSIANFFFIKGYLSGNTKVKSHIYVMTNAVLVMVLAISESGYLW